MVLLIEPQCLLIDTFFFKLPTGLLKDLDGR